MDPLSITLMLAFGLIAGIVGGLLGIGGCSIMLPALYFIFHYPLPKAIGTTITAVIITAVSGALAHIKMRTIDFSTAKIIAVTGAVGAVLGSILFIYLSRNVSVLNVVVGLAFIYTAVRMIIEGLKKKSGISLVELKEVPGSGVKKGVIGFVIGVLTGILGLGGGYVLVPTFIYIFHAPVKIAVGTSLASFISMSVISGAFKLWTGDVDILSAICLGVGTAVGAQAGARLVPKVPGWLIKLLFGLLFLYVSIKFILTGLGIHF